MLHLSRERKKNIIKKTQNKEVIKNNLEQFFNMLIIIKIKFYFVNEYFEQTSH